MVNVRDDCNISNVFCVTHKNMPESGLPLIFIIAYQSVILLWYPHARVAELVDALA